MMMDTIRPINLLSSSPDEAEKDHTETINRPTPQKHTSRPHTWHPPTDLFETDADFLVRVEVAGMNSEEFFVNLENNRLEISGSRPDMPVNRAYHQMEIPYGNFRTVITIPSPVSSDAVEAEYHDGFLLITLPKLVPSIIDIKEE